MGNRNFSTQAAYGSGLKLVDFHNDVQFAYGHSSPRRLRSGLEEVAVLAGIEPVDAVEDLRVVGAAGEAHAVALLSP